MLVFYVRLDMLKAKLKVVGGEAKAAEVRLKLPTIIGRGKEANLTVPHNLVSRLHTEISEKNGKLMVRDLGSTNGTFVNNQRITAETVLEPDQLLTLGTITFRAIYEPVLAAPDGETVTFEESTTSTNLAEPAAEQSPDPVKTQSRSGQPDASVEVARQQPGAPKKESAIEKVSPALQANLAKVPPGAGTDDLIDEPEKQLSAADTDKSNIFVFDDSVSPAKSVSASVIDALPANQPAVSFVGELNFEAKPVPEVEEVEIDLGLEGSRQLETDSSLGSFLNKLPR